MPNGVEEIDSQIKMNKIHPLDNATNQISDVNMHSQIEDHYAMAPVDEEEEKWSKTRKFICFILIAFEQRNGKDIDVLLVNCYSYVRSNLEIIS